MKLNFFSCLFVFCLFAGCAVFAQDKSPVIAFTSDTQEPMWIEELLLKSNQNQKATAMIFKDVLATHPAALFILGDVVSMGYKNKKWTKIDAYIKQLTQKHISVYATLGNHELMFNAAKGEQNFQTRFPMHNHAGYLETVDSVAVVLLNSNFSKMSDSIIVKQDKWYLATINKLNHDPAIKFIIVGCHHSPFTNSSIVSPNLTVRQKFVPAFISSKKCVLFLSGHSHNFEQFNIQGKSFLVIGGGGGLHQPLYATEVSHDIAAKYKPMFHYLQVQRDHDSLNVTSRELAKDFSGFKNGLSFKVAIN
ncbi:metallophosphoesterase family protein [Mucilaginibacter sp.]|uniref:metallophosphoesterase family protein n=1 Tax=Mucilaginibacter sp. TaxID=1882438 RepID=UPI003D09A267